MSIEQLVTWLDTGADELRQASARLSRLRVPAQEAPGRLAGTIDRAAATLATAIEDRQAEARQLTDALAEHAVAVRRAAAELAQLTDPIKVEPQAGQQSPEA
jgi:hypothetical protein